jgi:hypothetical protein
MSIDDFDMKCGILLESSDFMWMSKRKEESGAPEEGQFHIFEDPFVIVCGDLKVMSRLRKIMGHYRLREGFKWPVLELRG